MRAFLLHFIKNICLIYSTLQFIFIFFLVLLKVLLHLYSDNKNKIIMAYISTAEVKVIRDELKSLFQSKKGWKLSISREHSSCLNVKILAAPVELRKDTSKENESVSEYHLEDRNTLAADLLKMLFEICDRKNFNHSDYSTDYFHVGFYTRVEIGSWDKPFILNNN